MAFTPPLRLRSSPNACAAGVMLAIAGAATALAPGAAQAEVSGLYTALVSGSREGIDGGPMQGVDNRGSLPTASSLRGNNWQAVATSDDTRGGTVTANVLQAIEFDQPTYISSLVALSSLQYVFTLEGPDPSANIPVLFHAEGSAAVSPGSGEADISMYFNHDGTTLSRRSQIGFGPEPWSAGFEVGELVYLHTGQKYSIVMTAEAQTHAHYANGGDSLASAHASVDPTFEIQGDFADAYHFVGLPASSIVTSVPEPGTWAMMIAGLGCLAGAARRHPRSSNR